MKFRRSRLGVFVWILVLGLLSGVAQAEPIVVPNSLATVEGNSNNAIPFSLFWISMRYQQVYSSSEFPAGPILITQLGFRPDATFGIAFSSTIPNIQIDLSTTTLPVDGLDTTLANNVGADNTVAFNGALALSSSFTGPTGGPKDFDILVNLTTPFLYDKAQGNLLLDVRNFSPVFTTFFDVHS